MEPLSAARNTHRQLARIAAKQYGAISRPQLIEIGFTRHKIGTLLRHGEIVSVSQNVYRVAAAPQTWHQRLMVHCLAGPAVASHRSAAALWKMLDMDTELVEVTALRHRRRHASDVIWHESFHLTEREVTEWDGIPVTKPVRTILDLAVVMDADPLEEVLDDALRRGLVSVSGIWQRWEQLGPMRPGSRTVAEVLRRKVPGEAPSGSRLETRFRQLLGRAGIGDVVIPQYEIRDPTGRFVGRVDFAVPGCRLVIELDGEERHSTRQQRDRDHIRETELRTLGWHVLRFTWRDVHERPAWVVAQVQRAMRIPS